jgi:hypothetical protein
MVAAIIDKFLYGALSRPDQHMRLFAVVGNYLNSAYFISRYQGQHLLSSLLTVLGLTVFAYEAVPNAMGISTVWSFLYGLQEKHTPLDNWLLVPWTHLDRIISRKTGFTFWPWNDQFTVIAICAHALFALVGHWLK